LRRKLKIDKYAYITYYLKALILLSRVRATVPNSGKMPFFPCFCRGFFYFFQKYIFMFCKRIMRLIRACFKIKLTIQLQPLLLQSRDKSFIIVRISDKKYCVRPLLANPLTPENVDWRSYPETPFNHPLRL